MAELSRRRFLGAGAAAGAGAVAAGVAGFSIGQGVADASPTPLKGLVDFVGPHQAGIVTPQQDRLLFAAFDLTTTKRSNVDALLQEWTRAAVRMTAGLDALPLAASIAAPPNDTGEAVGLDPAHLTLTFGFGPSLFTKNGVDRFGLAAKRPDALVDIPAFPGDNLDPNLSGGDLCVQACADDPQVAYHAIRNLARIARGRAVIRWTQTGFGRTSSTTSAQVTPRNLMGFKDGTNNLLATDPNTAKHLWVTEADGPDWMVNGSYLVARRIRMFIEVWDHTALQEQERVIGRTKVEGAPLGLRREHDVIDLKLKDAKGEFHVPADSHIRLANQKATGHFILRRGYSFTDGVDPQTGSLDAGLFFLAYQRDVRDGFIPLQDALSRRDTLNEYIQHVSSAIFAIPPGVPNEARSIGASLFRR